MCYVSNASFDKSQTCDDVPGTYREHQHDYRGIIEMWTEDLSVESTRDYTSDAEIGNPGQMRRRSIMLEGADERLLGNLVNEQFWRTIIPG